MNTKVLKYFSAHLMLKSISVVYVYEYKQNQSMQICLITEQNSTKIISIYVYTVLTILQPFILRPPWL